MVDKLGSLLAQSLGALQLRRPATTGRTTAQPGSENQTSAAASPSWEQRVRQRIVAIDPEDPRRRQRAFHAYIEMRILKEFGEHLHGDAQFQLVVDDVVRAMESIPELKEDITRTVDLLLASAR